MVSPWIWSVFSKSFHIFSFNGKLPFIYMECTWIYYTLLWSWYFNYRYDFRLECIDAIWGKHNFEIKIYPKGPSSWTHFLLGLEAPYPYVPSWPLTFIYYRLCMILICRVLFLGWFWREKERGRHPWSRHQGCGVFTRLETWSTGWTSFYLENRNRVSKYSQAWTPPLRYDITCPDSN